MAEKIQTTYRAVLVPHPNVIAANFDDGDSSFNEASPQPGLPQPQSATNAVLDSSGSQTAAAEMRIRCVKAGNGGLIGAAFAYKADADAADRYRGWNDPGAVSGFEVVNDTTTADLNKSPDIITLSDGQALVSFSETIGGVSFAKVQRRSAAGVWGAKVTVTSETQTGSNFLYPTTVQLPDDRLLCFMWTFFSTSIAQVDVWASTDLGDTWTLSSASALSASVTYTGISRLRAAYKADTSQVVLFGHVVDTAVTADDLLYQWGSSSDGATLELAASNAGATTADSGGFPSVAVSGGLFVLLYVPQDDQLPTVVRLGSAFEPFTRGAAIHVDAAVTTAIVAGGIFTDGDQAIAADEDGTLYVWGRDPGNSNTTTFWRSVDAGATWEARDGGVLAFTWADSSLSTTHPKNFAATFQRGRVLMAHNWVTGTATTDDSLAILYLGGYTTIPFPAMGPASPASPSTRHGYGNLWVPWELPDVLTGWTRTETDGTGTEALSGGTLDLQTDAAKLRNYAFAAAGVGTAAGMQAEAIWSVTTGQQSISVETDTGAVDYEIEVQLDATSLELRLWDVHAGAIIGSAATIVAGTKYHVKVSLKAAAVTAWFREYTTDEDQEFAILATTDAATDGGGGGTSQLRFGVLTAAATAGNWTMFAHNGTATTAGGSLDGLVNPDDLVGRNFSALPVYVDDGVLLAMTDGPAFVGNLWNVDARSDFPVERIHVQDTPSPNTKYRSGDTTDQTIAYVIDDVDDADWPTDLLGIWLDQTNFSQITVKTEATPGAGFSTTIADISMKTVVAYGRNGHSLELIAGGIPAEEFYIEENEYAGCDFMFSATKIREITRNTSGLVLSAGPTKVPRLFCDDIDGSEPAGVTTGQIINKRGLIVVSLAGAKFSGIQIILKTAAATPAPSKGYFQAGTVLIGSVFVLGIDPASERRVGRIPNVNVTMAPDGRRQAQREGSAQETYRIDFPAIITGQIYDATADYILASGFANAEAVAIHRDSAFALRGLMRATNDWALPFVFVPNMPHLTASATVFLKERTRGARLVHAMGDLEFTTTNSKGVEGSTEVIRAGLTMETEA